MHRARYPTLVLLLVYMGASPLAAQAPMPVTVAPACNGQLVTRIEVHAAPPPFSGSAAKWQAAARTVGLHHATTKRRVIEAFLALHVGQPCTEFRRVESERVLRAQPYLADAAVIIAPDTGAGVVAIVETTDEIPVLVGARFRGVVPDAFSLGNANIAGQGLRIEAGWEGARAYQTGFGGRFVEYAAFDRPYMVSFEGYRHRVGYEADGQLAHPFYTDLQRYSWHIGVRSAEDYPRFNRPARDELALRVKDQRWDVSGMSRLFGTRTVALLGGAITGRLVDPATEGIVFSDTGLAADTGSALRGRYSRFKATRIGLIGGLRRVDFVTVSGFDALTGTQDVPRGVMAALYAAHGLSAAGENDAFLSAATFAGTAGRHGMLANLAELEGRRDMTTHEWNSIVGSTRTALYLGGEGRLLMLSDELSGGLRSRLPLQLTLSDRVGGIRAYRNSTLAGARRNVVRAEARWSGAALFHRADMGVAAFGEVGSLWAGDAPYGWTGSRGSVGVSLLAAYPTKSKRIYRADLAIPLTRAGEGGGRIELRFSSEDRTTRFWEEPNDVARARTGVVPSTLFAWPAR
ncbi:MAG: hypothetical protein JWL95_2565 [Gemmatimonadetes bacterium]|nr:hypothetical protein [Gemmatimonadota bacterium]